MRALTIMARSGKRERSLITRNNRNIRRILRFELSVGRMGHEKSVITKSNLFQCEEVK